MSKFIANLKKMHKSWTIWVNGIAASVVAALPVLADQLPQIQPYVSDSIYKNGMLVIVAANIALRFKTTKSLSDK